MSFCVSDNFEQDVPELRWGRPATAAVAAHTAASTGDGALTGNHSGTVLVTQDTTYTNTTPLPLLVTPVFLRPQRLLRTNDPQRAWLRERWAHTLGASPGAPTLPADITHFGGGSENIGAWRWTDLRQPGAAYAPLGQFTVPPTHGLRVSYQCRLYTEQPAFWTGSGRWVYAVDHTVAFVADHLPDPAV